MLVTEFTKMLVTEFIIKGTVIQLNKNILILAPIPNIQTININFILSILSI